MLYKVIICHLFYYSQVLDRVNKTHRIPRIFMRWNANHQIKILSKLIYRTPLWRHTKNIYIYIYKYNSRNFSPFQWKFYHEPKVKL